MKYVTSIFIIILVGIGCQNQKKTSNTTNPVAATVLSDSTVIISLEQTACYGTCPVYKITVLKNGYATYHGSRHVAQIGDYYATISEEQIARIYAMATEKEYFSLNKAYTANMTDLPTTRITINNGVHNHSVSAYGNYPENLQQFIIFLGNDFQQVVWTKKK